MDDTLEYSQPADEPDNLHCSQINGYSECLILIVEGAFIQQTGFE